MLIINNTKAIELAKEKLRFYRDPLLTQLDIDFQRALENNAPTNDIVAQKQALRDLPAQADGKTVDELYVLLDTYGLRSL